MNTAATPPAHVLFIGMPVADIILTGAHAPAFMEEYGLIPGARSMLAPQQVASLEALLPELDGVEIAAGGSLANSATTTARLCPALSCAFFASCANDRDGDVFLEAMKDSPLQTLPSRRHGTQTSRSYIVADEHGERAIGRYFGDSMDEIDRDELESAIMQADMVLLEGEIASLPGGYELWQAIITLCHAHGKRFGFTLFGAEQCRQHRTLFSETIAQHAGAVFGNEAELFALFDDGAAPGFDEACAYYSDAIFAREPNAIFCMSHGPQAPYLRTRDGVFREPPQALPSVVNTLGAGDGFMGGVLAGWLRGERGEDCVALGHQVAASVLSHEGPRPQDEVFTREQAA